MHGGAGDEGGEAGAVVISANSLSLTGGPSLRVSSQLSSLRHQRDQEGGTMHCRRGLIAQTSELRKGSPPNLAAANVG